MPLGRFCLFTLLGSLPWTFALAGAGYALAANWDSVASAFTVVSVVVAVLVVAGIVWWLVRHRRSSRSLTPPER